MPTTNNISIAMAFILIKKNEIFLIGLSVEYAGRPLL